MFYPLYNGLLLGGVLYSLFSEWPLSSGNVRWYCNKYADESQSFGYTDSMLSIIMARAENGVIGKNNRIPWRIRSDFINLKRLTSGQTVIIGRNTYDSMAGYYNKSGRPMPAKVYIIITRNPRYSPSRQNTVVVNSFEVAIKEADKLGSDAYVIGGMQVYEQAIPVAGRIYLTEVKANIDGDAFFPTLNSNEWAEVSREKRSKDNDNDHDYDFVILDKIKH